MPATFAGQYTAHIYQVYLQQEIPISAVSPGDALRRLVGEECAWLPHGTRYECEYTIEDDGTLNAYLDADEVGYHASELGLKHPNDDCVWVDEDGCYDCGGHPSIPYHIEITCEEEPRPLEMRLVSFYPGV